MPPPRNRPKPDLSKLDAAQPQWVNSVERAVRETPLAEMPDTPPPLDLPDIKTEVAVREDLSQVEISELLEYVAEKARRQIEAINLYEPLPIQKEFHDCMCPLRLTRGSNRSGKAQPVDEPVLTPFGWRQIGSLAVGDLVIGGDGKPARVTGVFPQGVKKVYSVEFDDGASTRCCAEHLWKVKIGEQRFGEGRTSDEWSVVELRHIVDRCGTEPSPYMRPVTPVAESWMPHRDVPLDPYLMGLLLGDGSFATGTIRFTTADKEMLDAVVSLLPPGHSVKSTGRYDYAISAGSEKKIHDTLRWYGLFGHKSFEKFVPEDYLFNSREVRLSVLQGLLDTDGSCGDSGNIEFSTTSERLAAAVQFLSRSLGGKCSVSWRTTTYKYKGEKRHGRRSARCVVNLPISITPFRLGRKADRYGKKDERTRNRIMCKIADAGDAECVCISVDTPDRTYMTKDFIVTHNTVSAAAEFARAVTGRDPHGRYPERDGRAYCVGKDQKHHGEVTYRKLFRAGAFKIIRDEETRVFRAYRPWDAEDRKREKQAKPAPPLIPPRFVKSISWDKKNEGIPSKVLLKNGWEINFLSSLGKPPQGMDIDVCWFDEEIVDSDWFPEMQTRLPDREGRFWWSATPQAGTDRLLELHLRCEAEAEEFRRNGTEPAAKEFVVLLKDNPHIKDVAKRLMEQSLSDVERSVRVDGEFAIHGRKVYPEFRKAVHCIPYFDIPSHWTNYLIVDPGRQVCAGLLAAVPPPGEFRDMEFAVVLRDEMYVYNSDAQIFAEEAKRKTDGLQIERMIIDIHGARITEMGSGKTVIDQYQDALEEVGVSCVRTGHQFEWGCDDAKAGVEAFRTWLKIGRGGNPKVFAIEDKLANFVWEIERYRYKLIKGEVSDEPETRGKVHLMACARYLSMCDAAWVKPTAGGLSATGAYAAFLAKVKKQRAAAGPQGVNLGPSRR